MRRIRGTRNGYGGIALGLVGLLLPLVACAGSDARPPVPTESTAPATAPLPAALLLASDLTGPGWRRSDDRGAPTAADWPWALRQCQLYEPAGYQARSHRLEMRRQAFLGAGGHAVSVMLERFASGWGPRSVQDMRRLVATCVRYEARDFMESNAITAEAFAGDESLLVESVRIHPPGPAVTRRSAVVRQGDVVMTVVGVGLPAAEMVRVSKLLSTRL